MGTIRSEFSIEQFEEAFQRFAHKVPELMPKFEEFIVRDALTTVNLRFLYGEECIERIEVYFLRRKSPDEWGESFAFTVELKEYLDSPHVTKIHYQGANDKVYNEKIREWIRQLMDEAGVKPKPRFSLKDLKTFPRKLDLYIPRKAKTHGRKA
jgi:hypothetical protein